MSSSAFAGKSVSELQGGGTVVRRPVVTKSGRWTSLVPVPSAYKGDYDKQDAKTAARIAPGIVIGSLSSLSQRPATDIVSTRPIFPGDVIAFDNALVDPAWPVYIVVSEAARQKEYPHIKNPIQISSRSVEEDKRLASMVRGIVDLFSSGNVDFPRGVGIHKHPGVIVVSTNDEADRWQEVLSSQGVNAVVVDYDGKQFEYWSPEMLLEKVFLGLAKSPNEGTVAGENSVFDREIGGLLAIAKRPDVWADLSIDVVAGLVFDEKLKENYHSHITAENILAKGYMDAAGEDFGRVLSWPDFITRVRHLYDMIHYVDPSSSNSYARSGSGRSRKGVYSYTLYRDIRRITEDDDRLGNVFAHLPGAREEYYRFLGAMSALSVLSAPEPQKWVPADSYNTRTVDFVSTIVGRAIAPCDMDGAKAFSTLQPVINRDDAIAQLAASVYAQYALGNSGHIPSPSAPNDFRTDKGLTDYTFRKFRVDPHLESCAGSVMVPLLADRIISPQTWDSRARGYTNVLEKRVKKHIEWLTLPCNSNYSLSVYRAVTDSDYYDEFFSGREVVQGIGVWELIARFDVELAKIAHSHGKLIDFEMCEAAEDVISHARAALLTAGVLMSRALGSAGDSMYTSRGVSAGWMIGGASLSGGKDARAHLAGILGTACVMAVAEMLRDDFQLDIPEISIPGSSA